MVGLQTTWFQAGHTSRCCSCDMTASVFTLRLLAVNRLCTPLQGTTNKMDAKTHCAAHGVRAVHWHEHGELDSAALPILHYMLR